MLQEIYNAWCSGMWATEPKEDCPCRGYGWGLSDVDTWHKCPRHNNGQPHPEDHEDPNTGDGSSEEEDPEEAERDAEDWAAELRRDDAWCR